MWERCLTPTSRSAAELVSLGCSAHWGSSHTLPHASCSSRFKCKTHTSIFLSVYRSRRRYPKLTFSGIAVFNTVTPLRSPALHNPIRVEKQNKKGRVVPKVHVLLHLHTNHSHWILSLKQLLRQPAARCLLGRVLVLPNTNTFQQESNSQQFSSTLVLSSIATLFSTTEY